MPYSQTLWSLVGLFPAIDSKELEATFKTLEARAAEFEKIRP